jgi:Emfourin
MTEIPVRVKVHRSGGFTGIDLDSEADSTSLSLDDAEELRRLVAEADLAELVPRLSAAPSSPARPDGFQYDVTVEEGPQTYHFTVYDGAVPPNVKPLLALVARAGRRP